VIHLFQNKLNQNEVYLLRKMMQLTQYPHWTIYDISKDKLPELKDGELTDRIILVFDETKAKSAFEKKLDELYETKDVIEKFTNSIKIPRPNTFKPDRQSSTKVWEAVVGMCNIKVQKIDRSSLPDTINKNFGPMLEAIKDRSTFIFTDDLGRKMEVRPDDLPHSIKPSMTYTELLVMVAYRYAFGFDQLEILSS